MTTRTAEARAIRLERFRQRYPQGVVVVGADGVKRFTAGEYLLHVETDGQTCETCDMLHCDCGDEAAAPLAQRAAA